MFSNKLAITWRLFGDSGDYLVICRGFYGFGTIMGQIIPFSSPQESHHKPDNLTTKMSNLLKKEIIVNSNNKPQMNADERRYFLVTDFNKIIHRKGRRERKATQRESLRSLRLNVFFAPAHGRALQPAIYSRSRRTEDDHFKGITEAYIEEQIEGNLKELE